MISQGELHLLKLIDLQIKSSDESRIVGFDDTRVAYLAVLIAPIGVIIDRSGQIIHFLGHRSVLTALGRSTKREEAQTISVIPCFLSRYKIAQRIVFDTFTDNAFVVHIWRETVCQLGNN